MGTLAGSPESRKTAATEHDANIKSAIFWANGLIISGVVLMATSLLSLVALIYCAVCGFWLQAIFILLARKQLLEWLDSLGARVEVLTNKYTDKLGSEMPPAGALGGAREGGG